MEKIITFGEVKIGDIVCKELADIGRAHYFRVESIGRYVTDGGLIVSLSLRFRNSQRTSGYNDAPERRIILIHRPLPEGLSEQELMANASFWMELFLFASKVGGLTATARQVLVDLRNEAMDAIELGKPFDEKQLKMLK